MRKISNALQKNGKSGLYIEIMAQRKLRKEVKITLTVILAFFVIFLFVLTGNSLFSNQTNNGETVYATPPQYTEVDKAKYDVNKYKELWKNNHEKNNDYVGQLIFDSGLIDVPIVQGESNDTYLRTDWETLQADEEGSIFLDYFNSIDDKNLVVYGHFVYPIYDKERTHKFTPLEKLLKKENYEQNKTLHFVLENEIREYEVVLVYYCELEAENGEYIYTRDDMQYYWTNQGEEYYNSDFRSINEKYFKDYIKAATKAQLYQIDNSFDFSDQFLTLQTCVENHNELREIVLCKEVGRYKFE